MPGRGDLRVRRPPPLPVAARLAALQQRREQWAEARAARVVQAVRRLAAAVGAGIYHVNLCARRRRRQGAEEEEDAGGPPHRARAHASRGRLQRARACGTGGGAGLYAAARAGGIQAAAVAWPSCPHSALPRLLPGPARPGPD